MYWVMSLGGVGLWICVLFLVRNCKYSVAHLWQNIQRQLGSLALVKVLLFTIVIILLSVVVNNEVLRIKWFYVTPFSVVFAWVWAALWLQDRQDRQFEESFPDALNMLNRSLSTGESIEHGIRYVGEKLQGELGREFEWIGERLKLGVPIDEVFRQSSRRLPYLSFHFFMITVCTNIQQGNSLKDVMYSFNQQWFEVSTAEKKKHALVSEAWLSAKMVCALPILFLFVLQCLSPEYIQLILSHWEGGLALNYLVMTESIGMLMIGLLMRRVK